jgi:hypothetical protein
MLSGKTMPLEETIERHEEPWIPPTSGANYQRFRSRQPTGGQPQWFICSVGSNLGLRTRRLCTNAWNIENTTSLYWFEPLESKTLCTVVGVDCLSITYCYKGRPSHLILASGQGRFPNSWSVMTMRPKSS